MSVFERRRSQSEALAEETAQNYEDLTHIEALYATLILQSSQENWRSQAACLGRGVDVFFPGQGQPPSREAIALCAQCPVQSECLNHVTLPISYPVYGYWAGKSAVELNQLRRERIKAQAQKKLAQ